MVQFLSVTFFFVGFLQFLLGFSKVPVFLCVPVFRPMRDEADGGEQIGTRSHEVKFKFSRTSYEGSSK